ncbi:MAG: alpha-amylase [Bacteroidales bacterium]|nr:alpha-amylase [Bacteroidales bacterium]
MKKLLLLAISAVLLLSACGGSSEPDKPSVVPAISLSTTSVTLDASGAVSTVTLTANVAWSASLSENWVSVSPLSGNGNATLNVSAQANTGTARTATVTIKDADGKLPRTFSVIQSEAGAVDIVPAPDAFDGTKRSGLTYQILVYSFADSDGDGVGDFKGIESKLDYLDGLGVTALWLSPAHPTSSYHGYDVNDYNTLNPLYGSAHTSASAEEDFRSLCTAAKAKGITIYMDYVLNHSGKDNEWFKSVLSNPTGSEYKEYYVLSSDPDADVAAGKIDNYGGASSPGMGGWHQISGGGNVGYKGRLHFKLDWTGATKYITVTETTDAVQSSNSAATKWLWIGTNGHLEGLYETSANIFEITLDVDTDWGFLVRTSSTSWDGGTKYGGKAGASKVTFGQPLALDNSTASNIVFGEATYYFASFDTSMPDLNYGKYTDAKNSKAFEAIAKTVDKWIGFGIGGLRLDAVIWIYQSNNGNANPEFLRQWYERCNTAYHAAGHSDDFFMVGETWLGHDVERTYYKGLPSCFEFEFFGQVTNAINNKNANQFAKNVAGYITSHKAVRSDAVTSIFLTNHDQNRAAEDLGKSAAKEKQAAAMLLTSAGKPYIYQGEELGYWGTKSGGDEYVRTPIKWTKTGDVASKLLGSKVDNSMLSSSISVEAQSETESSLLNVYKAFAKVRNTYPALANGTMTEHGTYNSSNGTYPTIACWYMTSGSDKMLVVHNTDTSAKNLAFTDDLSKPVALLGTAALRGNTLTIGANSSVVFKL